MGPVTAPQLRALQNVRKGLPSFREDATGAEYVMTPRHMRDIPADLLPCGVRELACAQRAQGPHGPLPSAKPDFTTLTKTTVRFPKFHF